MPWGDKWNITIFLSETLMVHSTRKFIHLTLIILLWRCTLLGPSFSHLITHNSHCCSISLSNLRFCNDQYFSSPIFPNTGSRMMVLCACMTLIDGDLQTQLNGCVHVVSILCPTRLKLISEIWCTMDLKTRHLMTLQPLPNPLVALYSTLVVGRPTIRHLDYKLLPMSRRLNREFAPMSRRLNRECPCEARGYCLRTNFHSSATTFAVMILWMILGQWPKWPHRLLW